MGQLNPMMTEQLARFLDLLGPNQAVDERRAKVQAIEARLAAEEAQQAKLTLTLQAATEELADLAIEDRAAALKRQQALRLELDAMPKIVQTWQSRLSDAQLDYLQAVGLAAYHYAQPVHAELEPLRAQHKDLGKRLTATLFKPGEDAATLKAAQDELAERMAPAKLQENIAITAFGACDARLRMSGRRGGLEAILHPPKPKPERRVDPYWAEIARARVHGPKE